MITGQNALLVYAIGTLLAWAGGVNLIRSIVMGAKIFVGIPDPDIAKTSRNLGIAAVSAVVLLGLGFASTAGQDLVVNPVTGAKSLLPNPKLENGVNVPLVWFVMPWTAWLGFGCLAYAIARAIQGVTGINAEEKRRHWKMMGLSLVGTWVFTALYYNVELSKIHQSLLGGWIGAAFDGKPDANTIEILRGAIPMTWKMAGLVLALVVFAIVAMVYASRFAAGRGLAKTTVSHLTLMVGSVVFGLPFVFLLITSFKEDRDMSSKDGIVWVPKVQHEVPYINPSNPMYEGKHLGRTVQGKKIMDVPGGKIRIDILKPSVIRGVTFDVLPSEVKKVPEQAPVFMGTLDGMEFTGFVTENLDDGRKTLEFMTPEKLKGKQKTFLPAELEPVRSTGLRLRNYPEALEYLPPETNYGLVYLKNTLILVVLGMIGTILSSAIVAYAFSRLQFLGRDTIFKILLATMMLPGAVTLLPQFLIFRQLGWVDTLLPLWVPAFFGSAFNIFLLNQFFRQIPLELEDAAKIDGCGYLKTFWSIMLPQIKPALAVIAIWTFMGAWNNFMGPLIYINSPENMPLSYALQMFKSDRGGEPGLMMAFSTLTIIPVLALFFFTQKYFIEGMTLSGLGGR